MTSQKFHLFFLHFTFRYRCVSRLTEKAWSYILENFVSIAIESEELLELNVDDFYAIVNDELLNVKVEEEKSLSAKMLHLLIVFHRMNMLCGKLF